jgi:hypothetical protein
MYFGKITFICLYLITNNIYSQNKKIYVPGNIDNSFKSHYRSYEGVPGENYWQNKSVYNISAEVFPNEKKLNGEIKIGYKNNSPDSLAIIVIRLYQDIFKKGNTRLRPVLPEDVGDGIQINKIVLSGKDVTKNEKLKRKGTILEIPFDKPLPPSSSIELFITWEFSIPVTNLRMGQYDASSFFIGYWYPQIAVYDDIDGWDKLNDTAAHEFYNEYADYEVEITVPENYIIWATGEFKNPDEVFSTEFYKKYIQAINSDTVIQLIDSSNVSHQNVTKEGKITWKYTAKDIIDFAFGLSDHYLWDVVNVKLKNREEPVQLQAAYNQKSNDFYSSVNILREYLNHLDTVLPKVSFPYPGFIVFNGYRERGMEFPMMANIGSFNYPYMIYMINTHELAHSYFPFFVGTNEKKYAWMDEGLAALLTLDFLQQKNLEYYTPTAVMVYEKFAGSEWDIPLLVPSYLKSGESLSTPSYYKSLIAFNILKDLFGRQMFYQFIEKFILDWREKHPTPYDLFYSIQNQYGEDLDWFWIPWFQSTGYPDLKIISVQLNDTSLNIEIKRVGNLPVPIDLFLKYEDGLTDVFSTKVDVWKDDKKNHVVICKLKENVKLKSIELNTNYIPDSNRTGNTVYIEGESYRVD